MTRTCRRCGREYTGYMCPCRRRAYNAARRARRLGGGTRSVAQMLGNALLSVNADAVPPGHCRRCGGILDVGRCMRCFETATNPH